MIQLETGIYTRILKDDVSIQNGVALISGIVKGSLEVGGKSAVLLSGIINGNIVNQGQLLVTGIVKGSIECREGNMEITGIIKGNIVNFGGKIKLHEGAKVHGRIEGDVEIIPSENNFEIDIDYSNET